MNAVEKQVNSQVNNKLVSDKIVHEVKIIMRANGRVEVTGPLLEDLIFRKMMCEAERAVLEMKAKKVVEERQKVIMPNMQVNPGMLRQGGRSE